MAVVVFTPGASALLATIETAIQDGKVQTWQRAESGDFTIGPPGSRLYGRAWLRPKIVDGRLMLRVVRPSGQTVSQEVYGAYQARFIELLLTHFSDKFNEVRATSTPTIDDKV